MDFSKYKFLQPRRGYVVIKELEEESKSFISSGIEEGKAYAYVVALPQKNKVGFGDEEKERFDDLNIGDLVVYKEYGGQELFKFGPVKEDNLIIIKNQEILCLIKLAKEQKKEKTRESPKE